MLTKLQKTKCKINALKEVVELYTNDHSKINDQFYSERIKEHKNTIAKLQAKMRLLTC
jgi:hypothetical protein